MPEVLVASRLGMLAEEGQALMMAVGMLLSSLVVV
jgi:hypothetical protein